MDPANQRLFEISLVEWTPCFPLLNPLSPASKMEIDEEHETLQQKLLHARTGEAPEGLSSGVRARMSVRALLN